MGTAVLFDIRDPEIPDHSVDEAAALLHRIEATFTVHDPDSEISRIARGVLPIDEASPEVSDVLATCRMLHTTTRGAFDHHFDGDLDPSGYVKGWAVERAAEVLVRAGIDSFLISAGGDIVTRGTPNGAGPWRIGIRDPLDVDASLGSVELRDGSVATSGRYERGDHIWGPGDRDEDLASVSIVGPDLGIADALATAILASGLGDITWLTKFPGYTLIAVTSDRRVLRSPTAPFTGTAVTTP